MKRSQTQSNLTNINIDRFAATRAPSTMFDNTLLTEDELGQLSAKSAQPFQTKESVFRKKKSKKRLKLQLLDPIAYAPRDVQLGLANMSTHQQEIQTTDEIVKVYTKKSLMWATTIVSSLGILEGLNILSRTLISFEVSTYALLGTCAGLNMFGGIVLAQREKKRLKQSSKHNTRLCAYKEILLNEMVKRIATEFDIHKVKTKIMLEPVIRIERKKGDITLLVGLPLMHNLTNHELTALILYHFHYFSICKRNRLFHLFGHTTQQPLKNKLGQERSLSYTILEYPCHRLHCSIMQAAVQGAMESTSFDTLVRSIEKSYCLLSAYKNCLSLSKKGELIPINAVTQIVCAAETVEMMSTVAGLHIRDQVKLLIAQREDSLELQHTTADLGLEYSGQWLLTHANDLANTLSMNMLSRFDFTQAQLEKTHQAHQAFARLTDLDPVQSYYGGLFRFNRSISPNLQDGGAGSLLTLKTELNTINAQIKNKAPRFTNLLRDWDQMQSPHFERQTKQADQKLEKIHLNLQSMEELLGRKSGLCLAITLSIASPMEQKNLYQGLSAHRKSSNIHRVLDDVFVGAQELRAEESSGTILVLRKSLQTLLNLSRALPALSEFTTTSRATKLPELLVELPRFSGQISAPNLAGASIRLITAVDEYIWHTEKFLVDTCQRVEERLNIDPLKMPD